MYALVETHRPTPTPKRRYLQSLLAKDADESREILVEFLDGGLPDRLYLDLIGPALVELGRKCESGEINLAQHNHAGQIVFGHLDLLRRLTQPRPPLQRRVVVAALSGDRHCIGARMVADCLYFDGFQVDFLGADTPPADLIAFVRETRPDLVGLSITMGESLPALREAVEGLRALTQPPRVLAGGQALIDGDGAGWGIDGFGADAVEAAIQARRVLGLTQASPSPDEFLRHLGKSIQKLRKTRGWSQARLAKVADIDRGYISSVENGRQNLTVSVALKIAVALEIPLELLLGGGWL